MPSVIWAIGRGSCRPLRRREMHCIAWSNRFFRTLRICISVVCVAAMLVVVVPSQSVAYHEDWFRLPNIPRFNTEGPRPPLARSDSPYCSQFWVKVSEHVYHMNTGVRKYSVRFWPDYQARWYSIVVWNGRYWENKGGTFWLYCGT